MPKSLSQMAAEVALVNLEKGWRPEQRTVLEEMMLIVTEAAEAVEAWREHGMAETLRYELRLGTTGTEYVFWNPDELEPSVSVAGLADGMAVTRWAQHMGIVPKPLGVASEAADILIRLLDFCEENDIDLENEYEKKIAYNRTRSYRHGGKRA